MCDNITYPLPIYISQIQLQWISMCDNTPHPSPISIIQNLEIVIFTLQQRAWIVIVRRQWLRDIVWSSVTGAELSLQFPVIGSTGLGCKQNAARMNVVLLDKCIRFSIVQQQFRLIHEDDLYSSPPEGFPFFCFVPKVDVPHFTISKVPNDGSILH